MTVDMERILPVGLAVLFALGLALIWRFPTERKEDWLWSFVPILSGMLLFCQLGAPLVWSVLGTADICVGVVAARFLRECLMAKRAASQSGGAENEALSAPEPTMPQT